jgi:hypothetical protein
MRKGRSLKPTPRKRFGDVPQDPIVRAWREINRSPRPPVTTRESRIAVLACKFPPFVGVDLSKDPKPNGIEARIDELHAYLERAGELDPDELLLADVQPFVCELHDVLTSDRAPGDRAEAMPSDGTLGPNADELQRRAWDIVNREFPGVLGARIVNTVRLLYVALTSSADVASARQTENLMGVLHQAFCTWLLEHRTALLTVEEWEELLAFQTPLAQA